MKNVGGSTRLLLCLQLTFYAACANERKGGQMLLLEFGIRP